MFSEERLGVKSEIPSLKHTPIYCCWYATCWGKEEKTAAQALRNHCQMPVAPQLFAASQTNYSLSSQGRCSLKAWFNKNAICLMGQQNRLRMTYNFVSRGSFETCPGCPVLHLSLNINKWQMPPATDTARPLMYGVWRKHGPGPCWRGCSYRCTPAVHKHLCPRTSASVHNSSRCAKTIFWVVFGQMQCVKQDWCTSSDNFLVG